MDGHLPKIQHYEFLLFDLDNTLLDYDHAEEDALLATFSAYDLDIHFDEIREIYAKINASYWRAFEEKKTTIQELKTARFRDLIHSLSYLNHIDPFICSESYLDHLSKQVHLMPGALELLESLHGKYNLCLVTNGISRVQHSRIRKVGFDKFFPHVVISEEIGFSKPNPSFFHHALQLLGNPPVQKALIIGDNLKSDIEGGLGTGMHACWFNPKNEKPADEILPTYIISKLSDLTNILTL